MFTIDKTVIHFGPQSLTKNKNKGTSRKQGSIDLTRLAFIETVNINKFLLLTE